MLKPATEQNEKLTREQVVNTQKNIETAFTGKEIKFNTIQHKSLNRGKIAVELSSEEDKAIAIQQLDEMSHATGFTTVDIPKNYLEL